MQRQYCFFIKKTFSFFIISCNNVFLDSRNEVNIMNPHIDEIKSELEILKDIIIKNVPTEQIYLFGSYAYGTPHKDSDIDIYIVMKDDANMREIDAMTEVNIERIRRKLGKPVDVLALKKKRFLDRASDTTMERKITRDGIKIYG
jgi:predicted nucleotidyltransferase